MRMKASPLPNPPPAKPREGAIVMTLPRPWVGASAVIFSLPRPWVGEGRGGGH